MPRNTLQRFTFFERLVHWTVGLSFVVLLLTGLAFSYPALYWLTELFGGGPSARALHPWAGVVFGVALVPMFVVWVRDMLFDRKDLAWLGALKHYALHEHDKVPASGKYNGGQKLFFWLQSLLGVLFVVSGVALWLPERFGSEFLLWMRFAHYLATLGGGLLLIMHVYLGTAAYPGTLRGMLDGKVSRAWARLHHPRWADEEKDS